MQPRPLAALVMLGPLAACATVSDRHHPTPNLVGAWTYEDPQSSPRTVQDCETDFMVNYSPDGTFWGYEESGTWRIEDGDLIETITETWEMGGEEVHRIANPKPSRIRLEWISPDVVNIEGTDGAGVFGLVRCRLYSGG